jgi:cation diffusion facilitator CzcD-associated flavoprotein CzcO
MAIVGSGFGGLCMAIKLREAGIHDFVILERGQAVGGTWRDNTYPGCECDVPSHLYSYSFEPEPDWPRPYARQADIRAYIERVTDKYELRPFIRFGAALKRAAFDERTNRWQIETSAGPVSADMVAMATGGLSNPAIPELPGLERFQGARFHSAQWDHGYDFNDKRVAVVGTGASTIQFLPKIAPLAAHHTLFQRTAAWVLPKRNAPFSAWQRWVFRNLPWVRAAYRSQIFIAHEAYGMAFRRPQVMEHVKRMGVQHIKHFIKDPERVKLLTPNYTPGCKRILLSNDYYPALARDNVQVTGSAIREVREHSIVTADGVEHAVDVIVFGTGFDVQRRTVREELVGRGGVGLDEAWRGTPHAYLGTLVPGFPNLFILGGPNSGLGHNSIIYMLEGAVRQTMMAIRHMEQSGKHTIEVKPEAEARYNERVQKKLAGTVWNTGCASYYRNDEGKITAIWPGSAASYKRATHALVTDDLQLG